MLKEKRLSIIGLLALFILISPSFVSAITGSIGNARMILSAEAGDTLNKYVLVKNVNSEAVNINISVSGNLTESINLEEKNFILQAGENKKAYFSIKAKKPGNYETKINVQFSPFDGKSGVGLSSTVILNVYGKGELPDDEENGDGNETINEDNGSLSLTGAFLGEGKSILPTAASLITTLILVFILIIILKKTRKLNRKKKKEKSS